MAPFSSFLQLQDKTATAQLFKKLGLPQPDFIIIDKPIKQVAWNKFPAYAKLAYGTAGQNVWKVENVEELRHLLARLKWEEPNKLLLQAEASAKLLCQAQAVFSKGVLVALHCTSQQAIGIGNSQSARMSVDHPMVKTHLQKLGRAVKWHGPLAVDYMYGEDVGLQYIEVNPRLVEPMNGVLCSVNMAALTVKLSLDGKLSAQPASKIGVVSSSLLATLLGVADRTKSRLQLCRTLGQAITHTGSFRRSLEDLTPLRDPLSLLPLLFVLLQLLMQPAKAYSLANKSIMQYSLPATAVREVLANFR